jgi:hypothetical protein
MFQEELHYTAFLQTPTQLVETQFLSSNPFLPYALKEKFIIQMSQLAFAVLSHYLSENGLVLITAIVNDRIQFEKSKFPETIVNIDSNELIQLNGYSPSKL